MVVIVGGASRGEKQHSIEGAYSKALQVKNSTPLPQLMTYNNSMKGMVPLDPQTKVSQVRFAVVYTKRQSRKRFPVGCVQIMASEKEAIAAADDDNNYFPAHVAGPSKSSEGQYIYYLIRWL